MELHDRYDDLDECLQDYESWYLANQSRIQGAASCLQFLRLASDGRLFLLHMLREQIVSLRGSRTNVEDLDTALNEYTSWYSANYDQIVDVQPMLKFLKKAQDDTLWIIHLLRDELREAEEKEAIGSGLWLPSDLRP